MAIPLKEKEYYEEYNEKIIDIVLYQKYLKIKQI